MDARRLGMGARLPRAFLGAAVTGYLTEGEWDALGQDWLEQALDYTAVPCKGVPGPLTCIRPRPPRSHSARPASPDGGEQPLAEPTGPTGGPVYRLADYLDQHGRQYRKSQSPPAAFWAAAADHVGPAGQAALGDAADARGLYRAAAQLHKNAAAAGNLRAASYLSGRLPWLHDDDRPVRWAVAHAALDDPAGVAALLRNLREAGSLDQAIVLASRAAAHLPRDDPGAVARLLQGLQAAGAQDQAIVLASRAAAHVLLDNPIGVGDLLGELREAGAQDQITVLAGRAAAHVLLDNAMGVASLLGRLWEVGAKKQATALADRAAAHVALDNPDGVALLLHHYLAKVGAKKQVTVLTDRAAADVSLDDPGAVAALLQNLQDARAYDQATALADRAIPGLPR